MVSPYSFFSASSRIEHKANAVPTENDSNATSPSVTLSGDRDSGIIHAAHPLDCRSIVLSLGNDKPVIVDQRLPSRMIRTAGRTPTHKNDDNQNPMVNRVKRNYFIWALLSSPLVGFGYWLIAFAVTTVGCTPMFADADFFGVPAMFFFMALGMPQPLGLQLASV